MALGYLMLGPPISPLGIDLEPPGTLPANRPDALTRLLEELARAPAVQVGSAWQRRLSPGERVGRFELLREVGRGGFGVVYEAKDTELGRLVAFKALRPGRPLTPAEVEGLRREAEAAAQLNHPNVVTVHDFGSCPAGPFLIMELLRGVPLSQRLDDGPLPAAEAVRVGAEVARALVHAHAAGVVHRDLKPGNVFASADGQVKVLDFGLASILGADGVRGGTPGYMAPEQCRGEAEDERTDLFALGVLLHRMLAGELPYEVVKGQSRAVDEGCAPRPLPRQLPEALTAIVRRLVSPRREARPASAREVLAELEAIGRELDPAAQRRRRQRRLALASTMALAALAGAAGGLYLRLSAAQAREHVTVAVADFANDTGEADLEGLSGMLITSLEQSHKLTVLTRARMKDELRKLGREDGRIDEALGRELGRATGARALLVASLHRFDGVYAAEVRALDPVRDAYLFTIKERVEGKHNVPTLIDRISEKTRRELRETEADVGGASVRVGEAFTRNLEAYRHYFRGVECIDRELRTGLLGTTCSGPFHEALRVDPEFALAHYQLAFIGAVENLDESEARREVELASRDLDRVPEKERTLVLAWKAHLEGRHAEALTLYEKAARRFPEDKEIPLMTGIVLYRQGELERSVPSMQRVLAIDPTHEWPLHYLPYALAATARTEELRRQAAVWNAMPPTPGTQHALAIAQFSLGDVASALATARRHAALPSGVRGTRDVAGILFASGDFRAAEAEIRRAVAAGSKDELLPFKLVAAVQAQGRTQEALRLLDEATAGPGGDPSTAHQYRALLLASAGDREGAWAAAQRLAILEPSTASNLAPDLAVHGDLARATALARAMPDSAPWRELWQAVIEWKRGDAAGARSRLRALERLSPFADLSLAPATVLAEIAAEAGDDADVVAAVQRLQARWNPGTPGPRTSWSAPRAALLLARAQLRLGRREEARRAAEALAVQWSAADRDLPLARELRELQLALAAGSQSVPSKRPRSAPLRLRRRVPCRRTRARATR